MLGPANEASVCFGNPYTRDIGVNHRSVLTQIQRPPVGPTTTEHQPNAAHSHSGQCTVWKVRASLACPRDFLTARSAYPLGSGALDNIFSALNL